MVALALACTPQESRAQGFASSGNAAFDAWRADFASRAIAAGRSPAIVNSMLAGLTPDPRIIDQDLNQAEFVRPVWDYINGAVSQSRIQNGALKRAENALMFSQVEQRYGVDADIIAGIWAMETNYGTFPLNYDAPRAIATLAFDQRRRGQFEGYLLALIEMVERGYAGPTELKSSWAGALGQPQFMPDMYLQLAVDWNGDGKRDIWNTTGDVVASIANYLKQKGWRPGEAVFEEAMLPQGLDLSLADGAPRPVSEWAALGVKRMDGAPWDSKLAALPAELHLPAGAQGPALLLFPNFAVIKTYNNSDRYALSVALLARGMEGRGGLVRAWPTEIGALSRSQILDLQSLLNQLGYPAGKIDGMFGDNTRRAVSNFQKANGFAADGYPTPDLLAAMRRAAGAPGAASTKAAAAIKAPTGKDAAPLKSSQIKDLQRTLNRLGYGLGKPTGTVGPKTKAAIEAEEKRLGLEPTGKATVFILTQTKKRLRG